MKTIHDITILLILMLTASGLSSCRQNDEPALQPDNTEAKVVMTLTVSDTSTGSRAPSTPEGGYDRGEAFENYIDISSLNFRFYFFDKDNKYVAPLEVGHVIPVESSSSSKTYRVVSFAQSEAMTGEIKLVVLANWPAYPDNDSLEPGVTAISDIVNQQYDFNAGKMELSATNPVPLYGVSNLMTLDYDDNYTAHAGTIHLLRAYAKVEVNLSPACVFPIEWVKLSRYNTRGYCAPHGIHLESDYVYNNYDKDYTTTPSVPAGAETSEELPFIKVSDSRWVAYVPEYRNVGRPDNEKSVIKIRFKGADTEVDDVYFAYYDMTSSPHKPTNHFDVLRNVWYKFTVNKLSPPLVQIVPYNEVDLGPLFGLLIGKDMVPIYNEEDGSIRYWYDRETGQYYGTDKVTPIPDPYVTILLPEKWVIIRDFNDNVIGYYDPEKNQYYDQDKKEVDSIDIDPSTGWAVIRDKAGNVVRYYDAKTDRYYAADRVSELDLATGWIVIRDADDNIIGYYDKENDKYYDTDKTTEKPSLGEPGQ
ncbi:MAG: hypothetical protein J6C95_06985 [Muribaculaceae bacterium]|nr:hypothetical protein [Muribaculaceae bacterium]